MSSHKHLVLDPDVHLKLRRRKRQTGLTVKEIGNSVLRSMLSRPLLGEVIAEKLIAMGKLSPQEYEQLVAEAAREVNNTTNQIDSLIQRTPQKTFVCGSWELREVYCSPDNAYQVMERWARDANKNPMPSHRHEANESITVLTGKVHLTVEAQEHLLQSPSVFHITSGQIHSSIPLTRDTRVVTVMTPPIPEFAAKD